VASPESERHCSMFVSVPALAANRFRSNKHYLMTNIILLNKPYRVLSQFTDDSGRETLANYLNAPGFRPAGRLDYDSEGLLVLTDDGQLQNQIASPRHKVWKRYLAQVEGVVEEEALHALRGGVTLKDGMTRPARASIVDDPGIWPRTPPIRYRETVPTSWLSLSITEGRNRQVRRMTAAVGLPTLRLIRLSVGDWNLADLAPGEFRHETAHPGRPRQRRGKSS